MGAMESPIHKSSQVWPPDRDYAGHLLNGLPRLRVQPGARTNRRLRGAASASPGADTVFPQPGPPTGASKRIGAVGPDQAALCNGQHASHLATARPAVGL